MRFLVYNKEIEKNYQIFYLKYRESVSLTLFYSEKSLILLYTWSRVPIMLEIEVRRREKTLRKERQTACERFFLPHWGDFLAVE